MELKNNICLVCGFDFSHEIIVGIQKFPFIWCPCCEFEYGIEDLEYDCFTNKRKEWIENGLRFSNKLFPNNYTWTLEIVIKQLQNLKYTDLTKYPLGVEINPNYSTEVDYDKVLYYWHLYRKGSNVGR